MRDCPGYVIRFRDLNITTRFARDAEFAEENFLSIAAETPAKESHSAADAAVAKAHAKTIIELGIDMS